MAVVARINVFIVNAFSSGRRVKVGLLLDFAKKYGAFFVFVLLSASVREVY